MIRRWIPYILTVAAIFVFTQRAAAQDEKASFHHIHLNVVDPAKTIEFYGEFFSGVAVKFRGVSDAVLTDRSYLLLSKVDAPAPSELTTAIYHIGWGGVDGPSDFAWRDLGGVQWETPLSTLGNQHYMYAYGPDREVIEVWTGFHHHRFGHVHLLSEDVNEARRWYMTHLGLSGPSRDTPKPPKAPEGFSLESGGMAVFQYLWTSQVSTDNGVTINLFAKPSEESIVWWNYGALGEFTPTDGRVIDHLAFSFRDIEPVFERMQAAGVEITDPIRERSEYKMKSFFVRGPDQILIEIVEALPMPDGLWD